MSWAGCNHDLPPAQAGAAVFSWLFGDLSATGVVMKELGLRHDAQGIVHIVELSSQELEALKLALQDQSLAAEDSPFQSYGEVISAYVELVQGLNLRVRTKALLVRTLTDKHRELSRKRMIYFHETIIPSDKWPSIVLSGIKDNNLMEMHQFGAFMLNDLKRALREAQS